MAYRLSLCHFSDFITYLVIGFRLYHQVTLVSNITYLVIGFRLTKLAILAFKKIKLFFSSFYSHVCFFSFCRRVFCFIFCIWFFFRYVLCTSSIYISLFTVLLFLYLHSPRPLLVDHLLPQAHEVRQQFLPLLDCEDCQERHASLPASQTQRPHLRNEPSPGHCNAFI